MGLIAFLGVAEGFHNLFAERREAIQLDVLVPASLDLFDEVEADQRLVIAVPRVHPADRAYNIRRGRLHIVGDLRRIASAWTNLEQIICDFFPNATSPQ